jgi:hypothetical protein
MTHPDARVDELYRLERGGAPHVLLEEHLALIARLGMSWLRSSDRTRAAERRHHGSCGPARAA